MTHPDHRPGLFRKGDTTRRADAPADAVSLLFEGYTRVNEDENTPEVPSDPEPNPSAPDLDGGTSDVDFDDF